MKSNNICTMGIPRRIEKEIENLFKEIDWKLPQCGERYSHSGTWSLKVPSKIQPKEDFTDTHYNKRVKNQKQTLESSKRKKLITFKETPIKLSVVFSTDIYRPGKGGMIYSKGSKEKNNNNRQTRILCQKQKKKQKKKTHNFPSELKRR